MESNIAKSLGYETEEELQDDVMLNSENLNKRFHETLEKERQIVREQVKQELIESGKLTNANEQSTNEPPKDIKTDVKVEDTEIVSDLRKQIAEMQERLTKIDKYSTTAKSQADGTVGKIETGDGRPDEETDNRFITKMMPFRNEFR